MFSISLYLRRNPWRVAAVMACIAIGVAGTMTISGIFASFQDTKSRMNSIHDRMITTYLRSSMEQNRLERVQGILLLRQVPVISLSYPLLGAANAGFTVYGVADEDLPFVMSHLGVKVIAGRLPENPREVVLPANMLRARGAWIDEVVEERSPFMSVGDYFVVGAIEGDVMVGFVHPDIVGGSALIILSSDSQNLEKVLKREIGSSGSVKGPESVRLQFTAAYGSYLLISSAISLGLAVAIAIMLSILNSEEYKQRRSEIGLLSIIGYPSRLLYVRASLELAIKALGGWCLGVLAGTLSLTLFRGYLFRPAGMEISMTVQRLLPTMLIPFLVMDSGLLQLVRSMRADPLRLLDSFAVEQKGETY